MDKNFQKNIAYNLLQLAVEARTKILYAHQVGEETYVMRDDYKMPISTASFLRRLNEACTEKITPAINEFVACAASIYVYCCEDQVKREQEKKE